MNHWPIELFDAFMVNWSENYKHKQCHWSTFRRNIIWYKIKKKYCISFLWRTKTYLFVNIFVRISFHIKSYCSLFILFNNETHLSIIWFQNISNFNNFLKRKQLSCTVNFQFNWNTWFHQLVNSLKMNQLEFSFRIRFAYLHKPKLNIRT